MHKNILAAHTVTNKNMMYESMFKDTFFSYG